MRLRVLPIFLVTCLACSEGAELAPISLEPMVTLGATDGDGTLASWPRVSPRHPLGYRVVVPQPGPVPSQPLVFGDSGQYLGTLAGPGNGTDDFVEPLFARIGPGDSVWVFDGARRALVFTPDRVFARAVPLPIAPWDAVVLSDGRIGVTPATFGEPLPWLLLDASGAELAAVGGADHAVPSPRRITAGADGSVWIVAMTHRWQVDRYGADGAALGALGPAPKWFTPHDSLQAASPDRAPQPSVQDAWVDRDGRLWIVGKVADDDWREGIGDPVEGASPIVDADRAYDTVIEVRDATTGAVMAEARFDAAYPFLAEAGVLMRVVSTEAGWHRAELVRVVIDTARLGAPR